MSSAQNNFTPQQHILDAFGKNQGQRTLPLTPTASSHLGSELALRAELCTGMRREWTISSPNILQRPSHAGLEVSEMC